MYTINGEMFLMSSDCKIVKFYFIPVISIVMAQHVQSSYAHCNTANEFLLSCCL